MAVSRSDVDYSKSTNAYPMEKEPANVFVESAIDYSKSTMAFPMYENPADLAGVIERRVEHLDQVVDVQFPTPGPQTIGDPDLLVFSREVIELDEDGHPVNESDDDDIDIDIDIDDEVDTEVETKGDDEEVETKVVEAPKPTAPRRTRRRAETA